MEIDLIHYKVGFERNYYDGGSATIGRECVQVLNE